MTQMIENARSDSVKPQLDEILVQPLRYSHISKAVETWIDAFANDPLMEYINAGQKRAPLALQKAVLTVIMLLQIKIKISLTVKAGSGFIFATPAESVSGPRERTDVFVEWIQAFLVANLTRFRTAEQRKRQKEVETKINEAISRTIGPQTRDMLHVNGIATAPESQGKGYGGALLDAVTSLADLTHTGSWLESSNIKNTEFYESHGFVGVVDVVIGNHNPTWHEPPVIVKVMVRKYKT